MTFFVHHRCLRKIKKVQFRDRLVEVVVLMEFDQFLSLDQQLLCGAEGAWAALGFGRR
jgi:hypothetical protein